MEEKIKLNKLISDAKRWERKERHEPIMNSRPEGIYNYLNNLWRNLDEYKPRNYGIKTPVVPEVYVLDNNNLHMFLAWYDIKENVLIDRQNGRRIGEEEFYKYSWCYKSELFPLGYKEWDEVYY